MCVSLCVGEVGSVCICGSIKVKETFFKIFQMKHSATLMSEAGCSLCFEGLGAFWPNNSPTPGLHFTSCLTQSCTSWQPCQVNSGYWDFCWHEPNLEGIIWCVGVFGKTGPATITWFIHKPNHHRFDNQLIVLGIFQTKNPKPNPRFQPLILICVDMNWKSSGFWHLVKINKVFKFSTLGLSHF